MRSSADAGFVVRDGEDDDVVLRRRDEFAVERHAQGGVEDDAQQRAAAAQAAAVGHPGIVGEHSVDADHGGVGGPAQRLHGGARDFAGDPVGRVGCLLRGRRRDARVERHGHFHQHEGALVLNPAREALVEAAGFGSDTTPTLVSMPAARSASRPWPATAGLGSMVAATTRARPAWMSASVQGGVRPVMLQGSRVT